MTVLPKPVRVGRDEIPKRAASFLLEHVAVPNGVPVGDHIAKSIALMMAGKADRWRLRCAAMASINPYNATPVALALAEARNIDLLAWSVLSEWGMEYEAETDFAGPGGGTLRNGLLRSSEEDGRYDRWVTYDLVAGDGTTWVERNRDGSQCSTRLVLDTAITGAIPETVAATAAGMALRNVVSLPILDGFDLEVVGIAQDDACVVINVRPPVMVDMLMRIVEKTRPAKGGAAERFHKAPGQDMMPGDVAAGDLT